MSPLILYKVKNRVTWMVLLQKHFMFAHHICFEQCQRDMKKTWATLSDILNRNTKKYLPDTMTINGLDCKDKQIIAEQFNYFFATIGELNERNIPKHNGSNFRD